MDRWPADKAREVVDFDRFLQQASDREWEHIVAEQQECGAAILSSGFG